MCLFYPVEGLSIPVFLNDFCNSGIVHFYLMDSSSLLNCAHGLVLGCTDLGEFVHGFLHTNCVAG